MRCSGSESMAGTHLVWQLTLDVTLVYPMHSLGGAAVCISLQALVHQAAGNYQELKS